MTNVIEQHREEVAALCRRAGARRLDVFGSAVRDEFDPATSVLDFLVEFDDLPSAKYADAYFALRRAWRRCLAARWTPEMVPRAVRPKGAARVAHRTFRTSRLPAWFCVPRAAILNAMVITSG